MFSDSSFAKSFKYGATKCSYLRCFGLFTYFHEQLVDRFRDAPCYSVSFDECMNKISQNEQMDLIVRYWDSDTGQDSVRYIGSEFLGHVTAADLLTHFKDGIRELDPKRLLHGWTQWVLTGSSTLFWHENAKHRNSPNLWTSAAEKSWKQFKLSWKSHGIVLSDFCGNPVIYGTNKNDINHSHFENI